MKTEEIIKIYKELKESYDFLLSPSEQTYLWAQFGMEIFKASGAYQKLKEEKENQIKINEGLLGISSTKESHAK